jgi:hypothetical protein
MAKVQKLEQRPEELSKELLGIAGEYAVASELCRRGLYAQLTLGNRKRVDLLVDGEHDLARIQVKTKQGKTWPSVKRPGKNDFIVLVDFQRKESKDHQTFFVLNIKDYLKLVERETGSGMGGVGASGEFEYRSGWPGLALSPSDVEVFKDRWDKILEPLGHTLRS